MENIFPSDLRKLTYRTAKACLHTKIFSVLTNLKNFVLLSNIKNKLSTNPISYLLDLIHKKSCFTNRKFIFVKVYSITFVCDITLSIFISFGNIPHLIDWLNMILKGSLIERILFFTNLSLRS